VVDNRPGAGGSVGAGIVAKATPDGYTLLVCGINTHAVSPALYRKLGYDPLRDFVHVSLVYTVPNVLVVNPGLPVKTVQEFLAHARQNPGKVMYASSGVGASPHLSMEWLRSLTGIDVVHVPYKGGGPAATDLIGGHVHVMFSNLPTQIGNIRAGRVRVLAVTSARRSQHLPEVPTFGEAGMPGFEVTVWQGLCGPAAMPRDIIAKLDAESRRALDAADLRERLHAQGAEAAPTTPEAFTAFIRDEMKKWAGVVKAAGVAAD
ncbi:MAG: tripartite tricarboxylate transporter substrate binding protein, partial [Burkholderiales bacterium]|nr:tripartite tricarboxylate transporter substrate binding protein [Burkholderiales bacterium]